MFNKKTQFPVHKTILILIITTIILISFLVILVPYSNVFIDDKKINTQTSIKNVLNCFSEEYGFIETDKYSQDQLDSCLQNQENVLVKIKLQDNNPIYLNNEEDGFENKKEISCRVNSNILCSKMTYPIVLTQNNNYEIKILEVEILAK